MLTGQLRYKQKDIMERRHCSVSSLTENSVDAEKNTPDSHSPSQSLFLQSRLFCLQTPSQELARQACPFYMIPRSKQIRFILSAQKNAFILFHFLCDTLSTLCDYRSEKQRKLDQKSFSRKWVQVQHLLQLLYPQHLAQSFVANSLIALYQAHSRPSIIFKLPKGLIPSLASWVKTERKKIMIAIYVQLSKFLKM